jgi:hypothetical protein
MSTSPDLDQIRRSALAVHDKAENRHRTALIVAVILEALFLAAFLLLADLRNRTHLLLLLSTIAIYSIVGAGLLALAAFVNRATLRVLKALELLESGHS